MRQLLSYWVDCIVIRHYSFGLPLSAGRTLRNPQSAPPRSKLSNHLVFLPDLWSMRNSYLRNDDAFSKLTRDTRARSPLAACCAQFACVQSRVEPNTLSSCAERSLFLSSPYPRTLQIPLSIAYLVRYFSFYPILLIVNLGCEQLASVERNDFRIFQVSSSPNSRFFFVSFLWYAGGAKCVSECNK